MSQSIHRNNFTYFNFIFNFLFLLKLQKMDRIHVATVCFLAPVRLFFFFNLYYLQNKRETFQNCRLFTQSFEKLQLHCAAGSSSHPAIRAQLTRWVLP